MLRGIERADSITVDPHKWFYIPLEAGAILARDGDFLRHSFLVRPEYYMERAGKEALEPPGPLLVPDQRGFHNGAKVNFFQYGIQGSRRFNALKVWLAMKMAGRRQYAAWVEKDIELARGLAALLRREPDFELTGPNSLGICTFRWVPRGADGQPPPPESVDQLNRELQELVEREGDAWFSHTILKGRVALRVNVENRRMEERDIERLLQIVKRAAGRLLDAGALPGGGRR
jgi:glutamate/tyrosine decarboxylase-like PLP-dependent enzyme